MVTVESDVLELAGRLRAIDPSLSLHFSESGGHFVVVETDQAGTERMVLTAKELDERIIDRVMQIAHPDYDYVGELDALDAQAQREQDHRFHEQTGEAAERMAHALRQDLKHKGKVFVP
jgi:hypothetical protein